MYRDWYSAIRSPLKYFRNLALLSTAAVSLIATTHLAIAQSLPPPPELKNPSIGANLTGFFTSKTPYEFWLTCLICAFGLAVIYALMFALRRSPNARPEDIARPIIVVTVITGTLMLITVGYNNEQIAPAFGLFGTIVGYMLGRFAQPQQSSEPSPDPKQSPAPDPVKP
jgi:DMSO reductase anchor subunit